MLLVCNDAGQAATQPPDHSVGHMSPTGRFWREANGDRDAESWRKRLWEVKELMETKTGVDALTEEGMGTAEGWGGRSRGSRSVN